MKMKREALKCRVVAIIQDSCHRDSDLGSFWGWSVSRWLCCQIWRMALKDMKTFRIRRNQQDVAFKVKKRSLAAPRAGRLEAAHQIQDRKVIATIRNMYVCINEARSWSTFWLPEASWLGWI